MKKAFIAGLIWMIISWILCVIFIAIFNTEDVPSQIALYLGAMAIATPTAIFITQAIFPSNRSKNYSIDTKLPLDGSITGPAFDLPQSVSIVYGHAKQSPVVQHFYDDDHQYIGFTVDFGNGKAGFTYGTATITAPHDGLQVKIHSSDGTISLT